MSCLHCRQEGRVEAASTKLTQSEIKEAQAPQEVSSIHVLSLCSSHNAAYGGQQQLLSDTKLTQ